MTAATGNSRNFCTSVPRELYLRASGLFWASLALISLAAFKLAQVRMQPDAIATGVPGFLWRLVLQPLELMMHGVESIDPTSLLAQASLVAATTAVAAGRIGHPGASAEM